MTLQEFGKNLTTIFFWIAIVILALTISYLLIAGLVYVICWAFGLDFHWSYPFGIMAGGVILKSLK